VKPHRFSPGLAIFLPASTICSQVQRCAMSGVGGSTPAALNRARLKYSTCIEEPNGAE
jgi:hypothetical protein